MTNHSCCHSNNNNSGKKPSGIRRFDLLFWFSLIAVGTLYFLGILFPDFVAKFDWLNTMAHTAHQMIHAMWWGVAIGAIFIGILSKVPREFVMAILGRGGSVSGLFRATAAGVLLDLCSHGILMVGVKLYERGASAGQVMAFLLASPWNSFSLTLILIGLIGFKWTMVFIALSMLIGFITGWVFDRFVHAGILPKNPADVVLPTEFKFWSQAKRQLRQTQFNADFFKTLLLNGIRDSKMVVRWLLFGIFLAALLRALFDPTQFERYFGPTLIGLIITIAVATVLEVCSEGSTPIAADIVTRANSPGNGFAFLMAGVSTDYTEVMILKDTTKSWKIALFLPLITVPQVVLVAWLINVSYGGG